MRRKKKPVPRKRRCEWLLLAGPGHCASPSNTVVRRGGKRLRACGTHSNAAVARGWTDETMEALDAEFARRRSDASVTSGIPTKETQ